MSDENPDMAVFLRVYRRKNGKKGAYLQMDIKLINRETEGEVLLEGRLDAVAAAEADEILMKIAGRFQRVVLNMEKLDYISSAGLRTLKMIHMTMKKKNGEMILRNVNTLVMEVFEVTGFVALFNIENKD